MGLLQKTEAIFYHPCNDSTEFLKSQAWTESMPTYVAGKVSNGLGPTDSDSIDSFGAESEHLSAGEARYNSTAALTATKFVVGYRDMADSNHGTARIGTVSGTDITFGAESEFLSAGGANYVSIAALSATKFVVAYQDEADGNRGTAKIGTVSGTDITFGAEAEFLAAGGATYISVATCCLDTTKFAVGYANGAAGGTGTANVGTVSGTDITFGAAAAFGTAGWYVDYISFSTLSETKFVITYQDQFDSSHGTAKLATISGTDITFGAEKEFHSTGNASYVSSAALTSTKFVVVYRDNTDAFKGKSKVGTVSGADITFGAETEFQASDTRWTSVVKVDSSKFVVAYRGTSGYGVAKIGTVSGTDVTFGAATTFLTAIAEYISASLLDSSAFVVAYRDSGDAKHGTAKIGVLLTPGASLTASTPAAYDSAAAATKVAFCGWFKNPSV